MAGYWKSALRAQATRGFGESWGLLASARPKSPKQLAGLIISDFGQWLYKAGASSKDRIGGGLDDVGPRYTFHDPTRRSRRLERFGQYGPKLAEDPIFLAPNATISGDVKVGKGCSFWFNAYVRAQLGTVEIGDHVHIMERAIVKDSTAVDNITTIGNYVVIEQGAIVEGASLQDGVRVGAGAIVMPGSIIGEGTYIKPNTVVLQNSDIQFESVYGGVPAERIGNADSSQAEAYHKAITALALRFQRAMAQQPQDLEQLVAIAVKTGLTAEESNIIDKQAYNLIRHRETITEIWPSFRYHVEAQKDFMTETDEPHQYPE